ncbi:MAG: hypothetical protein EOO69_09460 [Moraxellaceae bacterium]|nr:MAG: hypothetical protein EOO69_09460 [Moraxellaceae bacterium]
MNIADAKSIPLDELLQRLGYQPVKQQGGRLWYRSPFRDEKTASFVLSKDGMAWYDHGEGVGGNIIDLAMRLGDCYDVQQALSYIETATGQTGYTILAIRQRLPLTRDAPAYTLINAKPFSVRDGQNGYTPAATYLKNVRGIEPELFAPYLSDLVYAGKDGKKRYGFGVPNGTGGYEARRSGDFEKMSIGLKNITVFQSSRENWWEAPWHCFYGLMDFGTFLTIDRPTQGAYNFMIVNSDSMIGNPEEGPQRPARIGLVEQYLATVPPGQTMIHYPHIDPSGQRAYHNLLAFLTSHGWAGGDRMHLYDGFKDWNDKHKADKDITASPQVMVIQQPRSVIRPTPKI